MSKFLKQLTKGFVRSAVNQVGRDGGRVVSNKVYGDRHSIPIRGVSNHGTVQVDGEVVSTDFKTEPLLTNKWWYYLLILVTVPFMYWLYWFFFGGLGITYLNKKTTNVKVQRKVAVYTSDKRYKDGQRYVGQRMETELIPVEAAPEHLGRYKIKGVIHLLISVALLFFTFKTIRSWGWI